jgi:hypothetical protein
MHACLALGNPRLPGGFLLGREQANAANAMALGRPDFQAVEQSALAHLVRDVLGNPFRNRKLDGSLPMWRDGVLAPLAQRIYAERAFDRLPLLADALEDAGCTDTELLGHLRSPRPHVRGCWAVDVAPGRS